MSDLTDYQQKLDDALNARRDWLEKSELPKLSEDLRIFQSSYTSIYTSLLKRGVIREDPYKDEAKINEIHVPDIEAFPETEKAERLSLRLADFDNQLDFLVNSYLFTTEFLTIDRIKRIVGLIKYINWVHLSPDAATINTRLVAEFVTQTKRGLDPLSGSVFIEALVNLVRTSGTVMGYLKVLTDFNREVYKLDLRKGIAGTFAAKNTPNQDQIKKRFASLMPGQPFYAELVDEVIKEDYSEDGPHLQEKVLLSLKVTESKKKVEKVEIPIKFILIEGIQSLASVVNTLVDIGGKLDENEVLLSNKKLTFWEKVKRIFRRAVNKMPEAVIYELEFMDAGRDVPIREEVNFTNLRSDIDKRVRNLSQVSIGKGATAAKLEALQEHQLAGFLEKNIRDLQSLHRTLNALDEYFKVNVDKADREKVRGIKPELATIKNAFIRANQKRHDYAAKKEEVEQFKRLGITAEDDGVDG
ncbi:hypothetical protein AGMMS49928_29650 [Spirochaetia bacterium]|nr:hypothetical protein AGMMS49928_29650 [Spirochaetia bacterium]